MDYRERILDSELDELASLPALALEGAKAVGKTATAERRAKTVVRLDEISQREIARADPKEALMGNGPLLVDEWQRVPEIWDAVRRAVDDGSPPGPFLLTGSATPTDVERHSGAGRIADIRMRPMSLIERSDLSPTVSFKSLLNSKDTEIGGESEFQLRDYAREIASSGFPAIRALKNARARRMQLESYVTRIIDRDIEDELGREIRKPEVLRAWMRAYAAATATVTSLEKIRSAATPGEDSTPSQPTILAYRDALTRLFVLDPVDAWLPGTSHLKRIARSPKHHLLDPALAMILLGLSEERLLEGKGGVDRIPLDRSFLGALFESFATLSVRVLAQASEARTYHLRTRDGGHEIDLIVERPSGEVIAIEVKLKGGVGDDDVKHLHWLKSEIGDRLIESVVISTGPRAYRRKDGICVIPLALLGP